MAMNPLFPDEDKAPDDKSGYLLPQNKERRIEPGEKPKDGDASSPAVELIRKKIDALYENEPDIKKELAQPADEAAKPLTKHQQFMYGLSTSGKSLAEIQNEWHEYYTDLSDDEKHEVWQEFYQANEHASSHYAQFIAKTSGARPISHPPLPMPPHDEHAAAKAAAFADKPLGEEPKTPTKFKSSRRTVADIKKHVLKHVRARNAAQLKAKKHLQSLAFGLGLGVIAIIIFLFGFFNERFIIPFIQPSGRVGATPIILNTDGVAPSPNPEVIIPKINVQLPTVYNLPSIDEATIQRGLEEGIIHYPNTAVPGQQGNAAFFGHSSNNIFNKGKYKFAFVLLHELVPGDIFYITYNNKVYSYRVYEKKVVEPDETWVLGTVPGKTATAALITCDPPGTSLRRLVVWGEQITPDPNTNAAAATPTEISTAEAAELPSEGPSLWSRFWRTVTPW